MLVEATRTRNTLVPGHLYSKRYRASRSLVDKPASLVHASQALPCCRPSPSFRPQNLPSSPRNDAMRACQEHTLSPQLDIHVSVIGTAMFKKKLSFCSPLSFNPHSTAPPVVIIIAISSTRPRRKMHFGPSRSNASATSSHTACLTPSQTCSFTNICRCRHSHHLYASPCSKIKHCSRLFIFLV